MLKGGGAATKNALSPNFQTGPGNDVVAVWRVAKSRSWWDISDCSQHVSQVGLLVIDKVFHEPTTTSSLKTHDKYSRASSGRKRTPFLYKLTMVTH